jgi:hypothetical protein
LQLTDGLILSFSFALSLSFGGPCAVAGRTPRTQEKEEEKEKERVLRDLEGPS